MNILSKLFKRKKETPKIKIYGDGRAFVDALEVLSCESGKRHLRAMKKIKDKDDLIKKESQK